MSNGIFYFSFRTIFFLFNFFIISKSKYCSVENIFKIGVKVFCESVEEYSISCLRDNGLINKAYIRCANGYHNNRNISEQIIYCLNNGEWSEPPMKCVADCIKIDNITDVLNNKQEDTSTPTFNTKVAIFRKYSPGIIISEREVLMKCDSEAITEMKFLIGSENIERNKLYRASLGFKTNINNTEIKSSQLKISRLIELENEFCILTLDKNNYIKFDEHLKPVCFESSHILKESYGVPKEINSILLNLKRLHGTFSDQYLPFFKDNNKCVMPNINGKDIEFECFEDVQYPFINKSVSRQIKCINYADIIIKRCPIGYQNVKNNKNGYDRLDKCVLNKWINESENNDDCEIVCGQKSETNAPKLIVGGYPSNITSAPWHIGIYLCNTTEQNTCEQICGGTIIHTNIVITAGHCFNLMKNNISNYIIGAGKEYRSYEIDEEHQQYARIKEIHIPPHYEASPQRHDMAVIVLNDHLKISRPHVNPVCIEWKSFKNYKLDKTTQGHVFGFGSTSNQDIPSSHLYEVRLETVDNEECKKLIKKNFKSEVTYNRFCARSDYSSATCRGDSGGGFVVKRNSCYYLEGVVSVALSEESYCSGESLTAFTNIQYYQDFIKSIISESRNTILL